MLFIIPAVTSTLCDVISLNIHGWGSATQFIIIINKSLLYHGQDMVKSVWVFLLAESYP